MNGQGQGSRKTLGRRVRNLRDVRGWSQEHFAHRAGLDHADLDGLERGQQDPTLVTLETVASALGMTTSELLDGIERF